jgi:hypothetical protein
LDQDAETVQKVCKSHGMSWSQVLAPSKEETRQLWETAAGLDAIPRVLVIDSEGILRVDGPDKLEEEIARLLEASKQRPPAKAKP